MWGQWNYKRFNMSSGYYFLYSRYEYLLFIICFSDPLQDNHQIKVSDDLCARPIEKSMTGAQKSMPFPPKQGQTGMKLFRLLPYTV